MDWEDEFWSEILNRGFDYYINGHVKDFSVSDDLITAKVVGSKDYQVKITLHDNHVSHMSCNCSYGNNCKHMAAVLYQWESYLQHMQDNKTNNESINNKNIIDQATNSQIRDFLLYVLDNDNNLALKFKTFVNNEITKDDIQEYKNQVDHIIQSHMDRYHYIDYLEATNFAIDMEKFLNEDVKMMINSKCYDEAFDVSVYLFLQVCDVDMDDSGGDSGSIVCKCINIWNEILNQCDNSTTDKMFQWFVSHLDNHSDYLDDYIKDIFMKRFKDEKYLKEKLSFVDDKIKQSTDMKQPWYVRSNIQEWLKYRIQIMMELNYPDEDIDKFCEKYWNYTFIRKMYVSIYIDNQEYDKAIDILLESIDLDADRPGLVDDYRKQLIELYILTGNTEQYKKQLYIIITDNTRVDLDYYRELKSLYSNEEWITIRDKIFNKSPKNLYDLYKEEKMYDKLLDYALNGRGLYIVTKYLDDLKDIYPKQLLDKYQSELNREARHTASRSVYHEWVNYLRMMKQIQGGDIVVNEIVDVWKVKYKNRRALMDELRKL
ncbi:MAG: SWIM zinc finger family protein [Erysipelotrichaceae bacterium]|nr:SWIM zinc finger family protein [Erysipelotrichaceae bacterium]